MAKSREDALRSFIVFGETWAGASVLTDAQRGRLFQALYARFGFAPAVEIDQATQAVLSMMLPRMEESMAKYVKIREERQKAGRKGGLRSPGLVPDAEQTEAKRSKTKQNEANGQGAEQTGATEANGSKRPPITTQRSNSNTSRSTTGTLVSECPSSGTTSRRDLLSHSGTGTLSEDEIFPDIPSSGNCPEADMADGGSRPAQKTDASGAGSVPLVQDLPKKAKTVRSPSTDLRRSDFEIWYSHYPRHQKKAEGQSAWEKAAKAGTLPPLDILLDALAWQRNQEQWRDPRYVPLPASYINGKQWEDEPLKEAPPHRGRFGNGHAEASGQSDLMRMNAEAVRAYLEEEEKRCG